jgi:tRNA-splicing ligase RtcB
MDLSRWERVTDTEWRLPPHGAMRVPAVLYATEALARDMDDKVAQQLANVATLPGIQRAAYAMPDAHWGYGFPIGGVAAFDPAEDGVVSAGGVGFDISCGVRLVDTGLSLADIEPVKSRLADVLFARIPAGVGSTGRLHLDDEELDAMLLGGAAWAVGRGYGTAADLERIEEGGRMAGARPEHVSARAKHRQRDEVGTLGSGNHYAEVQHVTAVFDEPRAARMGLSVGSVVVSLHCGSRGLGHQIGTDYLRRMATLPLPDGRPVPDRELACAPIASEAGQAYLGAMRAGINCALANRQVLTALLRDAFDSVVPAARLSVVYDVSHNTCKVERHEIDGRPRDLYVHRKGATRAFGRARPGLPAPFDAIGQPVIIGGSMGTASYVLVGVDGSELRAFSSSCHGAGRAMSRHAALKRWRGREVVDALAARGVIIKSPSLRGVAEEAPGAYKDVTAVVDAAEDAGLSRKVARLEPLVCIKG